MILEIHPEKGSFMHKANKYYRHHSNYPANSEAPAHNVTHRHDKSIPGCTPAPRSGIYRPTSMDEAVAECGYRAELYNMDVNAYIRGDLHKKDIFKSFERPIFGAYGERL